MSRIPLPFVSGHWEVVRDANNYALALMQRHYSYRAYRDGRNHKHFVGPGEKLVLLLWDATALFVWRKFISQDKHFGHGVNCAVFRNEGETRSSNLILSAEQYAWNRWPGTRLYTYVNARKVRSTNPGYCFKMAGWKACGVTKGGLIVLEKLP